MSEHPTSIDFTTPRPPPDPVDGASAPVPAEEVTPEHDMVPRCGVCLCDVVETGTGADTATWYPCCRAATHIQCMVQCAGLHGSCPNCRAPLTDWITPSELERACSVAGVPTEPVPTTPRDTTHTIVNDYAARTFSMADLPEPPPPRATRALCCNRLAAPAMGFCELPDRTMTWAPVPTRGPEGIVAWHGQWLCQRCHREVRTPPEQTVPPCPTPARPTCGGAPVWEIDCRLATSRWACQTCQRDITTTAAPAPLVTDYRQRGPPVVPLQAPTFSCVYVPLLLAAVGALHPDAAQQWQASATMGPLWRMALNTLRATPFVRARHVGEALLHMVAVHGEGFLAAGPPQALATWVRQHGDDTITLPVAVGLTAAPEEGFYIPAPLQELLLTLWLGTAAASQLEQALTALRPQPTAPPTAAAPPTVEDATTTTAVAPPAPRPARRGGRGRGRGRCQPTDTDPALSTPRPEPPHATAPQPRAAGAAQLDAINLVEALGQRVYTFQAVPGRIRGAYRVALRQGLAMINDRATPQAESRGWKLFFLVSRMLLYRSPGQPQVPNQELDRRVALFERGDWATLLHDAHRAAATPARPSTGTVSIEARADRATALAHLGELSAASRALTAEPLAPGTMATLAELQNPHLRPQQAYPLHTAPPTPHESTAVELPVATLLAALRTARRGAAAGPSGVTNEHLRLVLTDAEEIRLLHGAAVRFARANIPPDILQAVRQGRMVALRKPNGSVRALVVGDVFRRLVSKALARHYAAQLQEACLPFQFGLSSRAGTEALYRCLRTATEIDPHATILSLDARGAFDHVSRQAMLGALQANPALTPLHPYARMWYGTDSAYQWVDEHGTVHTITQSEGGEQGDPFMPALFSLAQHPALVQLQSTLREGEAIFAYLDDLYILASPPRIRTLYDALAEGLWQHARIELNASKTRIWNAAGEEPPNIADLQAAAAAPIWVGSWSTPPEQQGLIVLGSPLGADAYIQTSLQNTLAQQTALLDRIPGVQDLQTAWLLLLFCANARSTYQLRILPPHLTEGYAQSHDEAIARCLALLTTGSPDPIPDTSIATAQLPGRLGGLGLRSAARQRFAAHWASWCDSLPAIHQRAPLVATRLTQLLTQAVPIPTIQAATQAVTALRATGYNVPPWDSVLAGGPAPAHADEPGEPLRGWQRVATIPTDERAQEMLFQNLTPASQALLLSQGGPFAGRAFTTLPTSIDLRMSSPQFRIALLRRLRMPLPLAPHRCTCGGVIDALGDHRAACPTTGILAARAPTLERAVAQICREAGARVARKVAVADMNVDNALADGRRIEVNSWQSMPLASAPSPGPEPLTLAHAQAQDGRPNTRSYANAGGTQS